MRRRKTHEIISVDQNDWFELNKHTLPESSMIELGSFCSRLFESYFIQLVIKYFFFFVSCYAIFLPHLKVNVACFAISNFKKIQVSHYFIIFLSFERFSTDVYVQTFKLDFAKLAKNHITFNTAEIVLNAYCVSIIFK